MLNWTQVLQYKDKLSYVLKSRPLVAYSARLPLTGQPIMPSLLATSLAESATKGQFPDISCKFPGIQNHVNSLNRRFLSDCQLGWRIMPQRRLNGAIPMA